MSKEKPPAHFFDFDKFKKEEVEYLTGFIGHISDENNQGILAGMGIGKEILDGLKANCEEEIKKLSKLPSVKKKKK